MSERVAVRLAITLGDPAGIGPEVALRALVTTRLSGARTVLIGDLAVAREAAQRAGLDLALEPIERDALCFAPHGRTLPVLTAGVVRPLPPLRAAQRQPGRPCVAGARVAYGAIETAVALAAEGRVDAICTAPLSKDWLARARLARTGHTEILAALTGSRQVRLMMALPHLRVVLATNHLALRDVPRALSTPGIRDTIAITAAHLRRWWGLAQPRIAVAALNPHASDGGVYGDEEARLIAPAIRVARRSGIDVVGPIPADTLFSELGPSSDAVVAMYHDQGLIPVKQAGGVHEAVNLTLGLPFVRTSPDHGTAYEIAGTGRADPRSMAAALRLAVRLAGRSRMSRGRALGPGRPGTPRDRDRVFG